MLNAVLYLRLSHTASETTATASCSESLMAWCDACRQSRTPPHVWSPALRGVTTSPQFSVSFIGCLFVIELSLSWPCRSSKRCTVYLRSIWLMTANSSLPLVAVNYDRQMPTLTCVIQRTRTRLGDRSFAIAGPRLWNCLPDELRHPPMTSGSFVEH